MYLLTVKVGRTCLQKYNGKQDSFDPHEYWSGSLANSRWISVQTLLLLSLSAQSLLWGEAWIYIRWHHWISHPPLSPDSFLFIATTYRINEKSSCNWQTSQPQTRDRRMKAYLAIFSKAPTWFHYKMPWRTQRLPFIQYSGFSVYLAARKNLSFL